jgi:hypothetical protein
MSKREQIQQLWKRRPHPWHALWQWGRHGNGYKRWRELQNWAGDRARGKNWTKAQRKAAEKARDEYRRKKEHWLKEHKDPEPPSTGGNIVTFDGIPCAGWIADIAQKARDAGKWGGTLLSGVRSVAHSIALCEAMCHQPSCPGTCAGATTNHTCPPSHKCVPHEGAGDFTDPYELEKFCRDNGLPLHGAGTVLPGDVNHFSYSGR